MIDGLAKQEISRKLGPLVTPERVALLFFFLVIYGDNSTFTNFDFFNNDINTAISAATENIKTTKTWIFLLITLIIFLASPITTHATIKKLSEISIQHSQALHESVELEAKELSKSQKTITELKIEATENAAQIRAEARFISRSTSFIFATGACLLIYLKGYSLIIPVTIIIAGIWLCYNASVELIKSNYKNVQKFRSAAEFKEHEQASP